MSDSKDGSVFRGRLMRACMYVYVYVYVYIYVYV
jgi:hypothetical protein